jgi:protein gp37
VSTSRSAITWTDRTWNPVRGCTLVSPGCTNCYAMQTAWRFHGPGQPYEGLVKMGGRGPVWSGEVRLVAEALGEPLGWKAPGMVFVNSMSDLFHEAVPFEFVSAVFGVMAATPQHTYQILTKRPERMRAWFAYYESTRNHGRYRHPELVEHAACVAKAAGALKVADRLFGLANKVVGRNTWPLPNVWLGTSVEDQERANERIPELVRVDAVVRFLSLEPLLGPVNLAEWISPSARARYEAHSARCEEHEAGWSAPPDGWSCDDCDRGEVADHRGRLPNALGWLIVGGESVQGSKEPRRLELDWARRIVKAGAAAGVPVFVKQLGSNPWEVERNLAGETTAKPVPVEDRKGEDPAEWPAGLRVREWPGAHARRSDP